MEIYSFDNCCGYMVAVQSFGDGTYHGVGYKDDPDQGEFFVNGTDGETVRLALMDQITKHDYKNS